MSEGRGARGEGRGRAALAAMVLFAIFVSEMRAEEKPAPPVQPPPTAETVPVKDAKPAKPVDDPTELSGDLRTALTPPAPPPPRAAVMAPPPLPAMPEIVLKALVEAEGKAPSALIEINGKAQHLVSEGSTFSVRESDKQYLTLNVKKIDANGVEIEIVQLKQTLRIK